MPTLTDGCQDGGERGMNLSADRGGMGTNDRFIETPSRANEELTEAIIMSILIMADHGIEKKTLNIEDGRKDEWM